MGILNDLEEIVVKAKAAATALGEKAGQYVDISKLKFKLIELKSDLKSEFENLGKITYENSKNNIEDSSNITVCVAQIDNLKLQIEELERQMAAMKNKVICHACRSQNEIGAVYCTKCGEKISDVIETTEALSAEDDFLDFEE